MKGIILLLCLIMTTAQPELCSSNMHVVHYVSGNACDDCAPGTTRPAGDNPTCHPTECIADRCAVNEYVAFDASDGSLSCAECAIGTTRPPGDNPTCHPTECIANICPENQHVAGGECTACPGGRTNAAGDDASGLDTDCVELCAEDQHVSGNECIDCARGTTRPAGDNPTLNPTTCDGCSLSDGLSACNANQLEKIKQFYNSNQNKKCS